MSDCQNYSLTICERVIYCVGMGKGLVESSGDVWLRPYQRANGDLDWPGSGEYVNYSAGSSSITLDGDFTIAQLSALVTWMAAQQAGEGVQG